MALGKFLILSFAGITLATTIAEAVPQQVDRRDDRGGMSDRDRRGDDRYSPSVPGGPRPIPHPGDGRDGRQGRIEQKTAHLNRRFFNETIRLKQLLNLGHGYSGYTVESVELQVRGSSRDAQVSLLADGRREDLIYSPQGRVQLSPRYTLELDSNRSLQVQVIGVADIDSVTVNLRAPGYGGGHPGREIEVPLSVSRRMIGSDRLELTNYIDMNRYRGYEIRAIEIEGNAMYNAALLDLVINGFNQGQTLQLDRYIQRHVMYPRNAVIGQGAESLILLNRGDLDIRRVTLRLSR